MAISTHNTSVIQNQSLEENLGHGSSGLSPAKVIPICIGTILIFGSAVATWLLYSHLHNIAFCCLTAAPIGISLIAFGFLFSKTGGVSTNGAETNPQEKRWIDITNEFSNIVQRVISGNVSTYKVFTKMYTESTVFLQLEYSTTAVSVSERELELKNHLEECHSTFLNCKDCKDNTCSIFLGIISPDDKGTFNFSGINTCVNLPDDIGSTKSEHPAFKSATLEKINQDIAAMGIHKTITWNESKKQFD